MFSTSPLQLICATTDGELAGAHGGCNHAAGMGQQQVRLTLVLVYRFKRAVVISRVQCSAECQINQFGKRDAPSHLPLARCDGAAGTMRISSLDRLISQAVLLRVGD